MFLCPSGVNPNLEWQGIFVDRRTQVQTQNQGKVDKEKRSESVIIKWTWNFFSPGLLAKKQRVIFCVHVGIKATFCVPKKALRKSPEDLVLVISKAGVTMSQFQ